MDPREVSSPGHFRLGGAGCSGTNGGITAGGGQSKLTASCRARLQACQVLVLPLSSRCLLLCSANCAAKAPPPPAPCGALLPPPRASARGSAVQAAQDAPRLHTDHKARLAPGAWCGRPARPRASQTGGAFCATGAPAPAQPSWPGESPFVPPSLPIPPPLRPSPYAAPASGREL